jgi:segregation and condensation protein A
MTYTVKTQVFEGPFDLLLHLVSKQKLDVASISVVDITDQYLEHVDRMHELDLDIASDFLLVAATLLEIKAASLLPEEIEYTGDELDDLSPEDARELLVARLITYKKFKNVSAELAARIESESRMHPRQAGLESEFLKLMPDFLEGITLRGLAVICADLEHRREVLLLQAEHVAARPISLQLHAESVARTLSSKRTVGFKELLGDDPTPELVVVTLLAILELYKRGLADLRQDEHHGDIMVTAVDREGLEYQDDAFGTREEEDGDQT